MEGTKQEITDRQQNIYALAKQFQGLAAGAENGQRGYRLTYAIAYLRDFLFNLDILGETFETSVPWIQIHNGGYISHDRGLWKIRADFIEDSQSPASIELVQKFKQTANPQTIFGISNNSCSSTASTIVDFSHE